jgi:multiple sugar transport system ATP-binding protein
VEGQQSPLTVRADGEVQLNYGDTVYLSPEEDKVHKFDNNGKAIR